MHLTKENISEPKAAQYLSSRGGQRSREVWSEQTANKIDLRHLFRVYSTI